MKEEVVQMPIDHLQANPLQPRGVITPDSLADLVDSIKTHGIIQPLVVAHTPAGFQIIAGERRWRAARLAGLTQVPVVIRETSPQGMLEMAIIENVQRVDLNPIDRAKSFERLMAEFGLVNSDICSRIGKSASYVSNSLKLLELPDALKDGLISGIISEGHARALAAIPDTARMIEAYKIILKEGGSVRRAEDLARRFKKNLNAVPQSSGFDTNTINEEIDIMAASLQRKLGKNTRVKIRRSRVETAIHIVLRGNPVKTESQIQLIYESLMPPVSQTLAQPNTGSNIAPPASNSVPASDPKSTTPPPDLSVYDNPFEPLLDDLDDDED